MLIMMSKGESRIFTTKLFLLVSEDCSYDKD